MWKIPYPASIELARLDTPLIALERLSNELDLQILCKRDDLTGSALSGNKVRKLEFLLAGAVDAGAGGVITCGGEQSNHARATALAAARIGLQCHLMLRAENPNEPPATRGNILLGKLAGATVEWIDQAAYASRDQLLAERAEQLGKERGEKFYVIPEGGSNELGAWGYVRCLAEIGEQLGRRPATIVHAVGSGGTTAGLIAGIKHLQLPYHAVGVSVGDSKETFQKRISSILTAMAEQYRIDVQTEPEGIAIWEHAGKGYAKSTPEELKTITKIAREEGLVLDPVYTGKAMHGLLAELANGSRVLPDPIVFLHTGGIFGLMGHDQEMAQLLDDEAR